MTGASTGAARRPIPRGKRFAFVFASMALPLVLLGLIEGVLRLCGVGGYAPVVRPLAQLADGVLVTTDNHGAASYFYSSLSRGGTLNEVAFPSRKPSGVFRVMLFGESAVKGFPQSPAFSSGRFLREMLTDAWQGRPIEVINFGTTAVASFPVLDILQQALPHRPDLAVIYVGNNEFFGAFGVASLHSSGNSPVAIRMLRSLRSLALAQFALSFQSPPERIPDRNRTLMEIMVGQSYTAPDDPIRVRAAGNLETHVGEMIECCKSAGVPVLVCTLPANERDLAPLGTDDLSKLSTAERDETARGLAAAETALGTASQAGEAESLLRGVLKSVPQHARANYLLGRALSAQQRFDEAAVCFRAALDNDPMPWRAPTAANDAVRRAVQAHGVLLCDLQGAFRAESPSAGIGWELMDDHVHPSLQGQALVARTIVETLTRATGSARVDPAAAAKLLSWEAYAERLGDNIYDRYAAAHQLRVLHDIPFIRQTNPEAHQRFDRIARECFAQMPIDAQQAAQEWQKPETHPGTPRPISSMAAKVLIRLGRTHEAERLYRVALECVSQYHAWNIEYSYFLLASRERANRSLNDDDRASAAAAIERGRIILEHGKPEPGNTERYIGRLHQLRGEFAEAIPWLQRAIPNLGGMDRVATDQALVVSFLKSGRRDEALRVIDYGIAQSGQYAELYRKMKSGLGSPP